jgi:hypothetical protein
MKLTLIITVIFVFSKWDGMDWIKLAQDRDQWRALVSTGDEPLGS